MDDLKTLVNKLLCKRPDVIYEMFGPGAQYQNKDFIYDIMLSESKHIVTLNIQGNVAITSNYDIELTEKEYMELKWKIEAWRDELQNSNFETFKEFVNEIPERGMDDLLND